MTKLAIPDTRPTYEQLERQLRLAESSNSALLVALKKSKRIAKDRMARLKNRGKLLIAERAAHEKTKVELNMRAYERDLARQERDDILRKLP